MKNTEPLVVSIYGDSNTAGQMPYVDEYGQDRYSYDQRFTGILQQLAGNGWIVIEEGLCGRTAGSEGHLTGDAEKNGFTLLAPTLERNLGVDVLVFFLGTNDMKDRFNKFPEDIAANIEKLIIEARRVYAEKGMKLPKIILMAPPEIVGKNIKPPYKMQFAEEKSKGLGSEYQKVAERQNCMFIDAAKIVEPSPADGMHLEPGAHWKIARVLEKAVQKLEAQVKSEQ